MANQAIALQARAPQGNFLAPAIQQGAQMINMMSQQRAAERQAAVQQQSMEIARAKEQRDITQAQIDNDGKKIDFYTKRAGQTMNAAGYELLLRDMEKDSPAFAEAFRANLPPERFDRNELLKMVGSVSDNFKATYGPLETEVVQLENGDYAVTVTGGYGKNTGVFELPGYKLAPRGAAPSAAPATPSATPPSAPATATGGMFRPAAFSADQGPDPQAALLASLNEAKQTGQIGADVVEQLRQLGGPQAAPRVDAFLAQNNIKVAPGGMQSAVYRPDGGAPMAQQVQFDPNAYVATGQTARGKPPMQSPMPGSAIVPLPRVAGEAGAETKGREGVRVVTQPRIVAGEERAKRLEKLRGDQPLALSDAKSVISDMDDRIAAIDEFLRNPNRRSIIGAVEGRIPKFAQNERRADVQGLYDSIVSNQVLNELIKGRQQTETGASPMGIVSDRDLAIAAAASNRLTQTGSEEAQEKEMQRLRDILYRTRQLAIKTYGDAYREVAKDAPELRLDVAPIADRYKARPEAPASETRRGSAIDALIKKHGG
jgi:hypothetical protein